MKEVLATVATVLAFLISLGQLDPSMTLGEFVGTYSPQPQAVSAEREAAETVTLAENAVPKPEAEVPLIIVNEPATPEAVPTTEPVVPEVTLTIGESAVPEAIPTEPITPEVTLTVGDSSYSEADAKAIAKVMHAEAKGLNAVQKRAVGWCILNRVEDWGGTIRGVAESSAFVSSGSYTEEELALANEVLTSWTVDGPRDLPEGYYYFNGNGEQNFFRKELSGERLSLM